MVQKYANQRYALSSHWKICRRMCDSISGYGDLDLWSFDPETSLLVASKVGNLHSEFRHTGLRVLELFAMYETDDQTDGRTDKSSLLPLSFWAGRNKDIIIIITLLIFWPSIDIIPRDLKKLKKVIMGMIISPCNQGPANCHVTRWRWSAKLFIIIIIIISILF